jgi:hypothetical protein
MKLKWAVIPSMACILICGGCQAAPESDPGTAAALPYPIVDTGVTEFYSATSRIAAPISGEAFFGQDATYQGNLPSYTDNRDGTVTDNVTGLTWQQDMGAKMTFAEAQAAADSLVLGGYDDWRIPGIKELYSLIQFTGQSGGETAIKKFIDETYFFQPIGDTSAGEREIDAQTWSATRYVGMIFGQQAGIFGVNFIDGRIKSYPETRLNQPNCMYFRMVRGNPQYGINEFVDNGNGTISDRATGLMWQQADDGIARDWQAALAYAENLVLAGHSDWRLPNVKELQSIVDYTRCPSLTQSAAIDARFRTTAISDPDGVPGQYPYFWSSTSHLDGPDPCTPAAYVAFGAAQGRVNGVLLDVHGAGAQRSDPKSGNRADYPQYMGPQGDVRYVYNYVRCVRDSGSAK